MWLVVLPQLALPLIGQDSKLRFEAGPVFTATSLNYVLDYKLRFGGGRFVWNATPRFSVEGSFLANFSVPNTVTARDGGRAISALFGPKYNVFRYRNLSVFVKSAVGFLTFGQTLRGIIAPDFHVVSERKVYPSLDLGGGLQIQLHRRISLRGDISDLLIFYREAKVQDDLAGVNSVLPPYSQHSAAISGSILFHF